MITIVFVSLEALPGNLSRLSVTLIRFLILPIIVSKRSLNEQSFDEAFNVSQLKLTLKKANRIKSLSKLGLIVLSLDKPFRCPITSKKVFSA